MNAAHLRIAPGLVLPVYVTVHLSNHALGLVSPEAMEAMSHWEHALDSSNGHYAQFNRVQAEQTGATLKIALGIPAGEAIVGRMGPTNAPIISAFGGNVNVAARLEALFRDFSCTRVISNYAAQLAGLASDAGERPAVTLKGRAEPMPVKSFDDLSDLSDFQSRMPPPDSARPWETDLRREPYAASSQCQENRQVPMCPPSRYRRR